MINFNYMNQEEHQRIVQAGLSHFKKPKDSTDIDQLLANCEQKIISIRSHASLFAQAERDAGRDTTSESFKKLLWEDLQSKFFDLSVNFSHDELVMVMTVHWSASVMKEIVGNYVPKGLK